MKDVLAKKIQVLIEQEIQEIVGQIRPEGDILPAGELNELLELYARITAVVPVMIHDGPIIGAPFGMPVRVGAAVQQDTLVDRLMDTFSSISKTQNEGKNDSVRRATDLLMLADMFKSNDMEDAQKKCVNTATKIIMEVSDESLCAKLLG